METAGATNQAPEPAWRLAELLGSVDGRQVDASVTNFGAWGPWIDGGAWLQFEGQKVDWLYRDLGR
jgi:hypothetical protein